MPLRQHGFTLLESMIVIAIMAILVSVALPSLVDAQNSNRVDSVQRDLLSVMNQGRTQAVNEGDRITLCGSSDGLHCDNDWSSWILFRGPAPASSETAVEPLFVGSAGRVPMTASEASVTWQSTGEAGQILTLGLYCDDLNLRRSVELSVIGRAAGSIDVDKDGPHTLHIGACS